MRRSFVLAMLVAGLAIGSLAAQAKLPTAPPKSDAEKAAEAEKAKAVAAKEADQLSKAQDRAVANYKRNKGGSMDARPKKASSKK